MERRNDALRRSRRLLINDSFWCHRISQSVIENVVLPKLKRGDKVAILSPSFAAPGKYPQIYNLGLSRLRNDFALEPVEYPTTAKLSAPAEERAQDLVDAFADNSIKAIITSIGGDDQIKYVKNLPSGPFTASPKPFFGFSDNTHFANFLWLNGVPSYYGGALFSQFAMQNRMEPYTVEFLKHALFDVGEFEIYASDRYNDIDLDWNDPSNNLRERTYEQNEGWFWHGSQDAEGFTWGGCLESIDELLRHDVPIPTLQDFENVVLICETSEEIPSPQYVYRVFRALGERGILERLRGILIGRPKAWSLSQPHDASQKQQYRQIQRETILKAVRPYNNLIPVVQNLDFGHTNPQIAMPYGGKVQMSSALRKIFAVY
jgi:muramoyltetrapeptide carboxypeptidase LdcA involved in peptidoglycan recycling